MLRRWCLTMERPPFRSRWTCLRPKDRRDRRLQGRSADLRAGRVRQAVELVEAHGAFLISVTHAFNTTMSTGPLTLNMLFSRWRALGMESAHPSKQRERAQFLACRFAKVLQRIDALTGSHQLPEIGDGPIGPEIGVDD